MYLIINVWLLFSQTSAETQYLNPRAGRLHENKTVVKWFISINKYRTSWKFITKLSRLWKQYKTPYTNTIVNSRPNSALCLEVSWLNVTDYTHNKLSWNQNLWKFCNPSTVRKHFFKWTIPLLSKKVNPSPQWIFWKKWSWNKSDWYLKSRLHDDCFASLVVTALQTDRQTYKQIKLIDFSFFETTIKKMTIIT